MSFAFVAVSDAWIQNCCCRGCRGNRPFTASGSTLHGFVVRKSCDTDTVRHVPTNAGVSAFFASIATPVSLPSCKRTEGLHSSARSRHFLTKVLGLPHFMDYGRASRSITNIFTPQSSASAIPFPARAARVTFLITLGFDSGFHPAQSNACAA